VLNWTRGGRRQARTSLTGLGGGRSFDWEVFARIAGYVGLAGGSFTTSGNWVTWSALSSTPRLELDSSYLFCNYSRRYTIFNTLSITYCKLGAIVPYQRIWRILKETVHRQYYTFIGLVYDMSQLRFGRWDRTSTAKARLKILSVHQTIDPISVEPTPLTHIPNSRPTSCGPSLC